MGVFSFVGLEIPGYRGADSKNGAVFPSPSIARYRASPQRTSQLEVDNALRARDCVRFDTARQPVSSCASLSQQFAPHWHDRAGKLVEVALTVFGIPIAIGWRMVTTTLYRVWGWFGSSDVRYMEALIKADTADEAIERFLSELRRTSINVGKDPVIGHCNEGKVCA